MRIIFTGQPGIQKRKVIENLAFHIYEECDKSDEWGYHNFVWHQHSVEDYLGIMDTDDGESDIVTWLDSPPKKRNEEWSVAMNQVNNVTPQAPPPYNVFLSMQCVFLRNGEFFSPLDMDRLRAFGPDLFVTLIDDVHDIWWRLEKSFRGYSRFGRITLLDVMSWRSQEILVTDFLARNLLGTGKTAQSDEHKLVVPHYVVAVKHPVSTLTRLLLGRSAMRVYASFPITDPKRDIRKEKAEAQKEGRPFVEPGIVKEINIHRKKLHDLYITFDPLTIDDYAVFRFIIDGTNG